MKVVWDPNKIKTIRKAIKKIRIEKLNRMIEDNSLLDQWRSDLKAEKEGEISLIDKTLVSKEENVLVSGNPKQGLKLKIHNSGMKYIIDPKHNLKDQERISEMSNEEKNHRSKMNEFVWHLERRSMIINKINELKERK